MAKVVIVAGDTGTGKSTSIKNLDPKETYIINVLNKPLPFKGSKSLYNEANKNIASVSDWGTVKTLIEGVSKNRPEIKNIIVDDIGFVMTSEFFDRSSEKGFDKFSDIGKHMQAILNSSKNQRDDLNIALFFHDEDDMSEKFKVGRKIKTIGQLLEDKYNPLAIVSVALFTNVSFDKDGQADYGFITNRSLIGNIMIPAKSPDGMFTQTKIPNDLALVFKAMDEYYN
jgi:hypothetical protein